MGKRVYTAEQKEARNEADRKRYAKSKGLANTKKRAASKRKGDLAEEVVAVEYVTEYQLPVTLMYIGGSLGKAVSVIEAYDSKRQHTEAQRANYDRALLTIKHMEEAYQAKAAHVLDDKDILGRRNTSEWKQVDLIDYQIGF